MSETTNLDVRVATDTTLNTLGKDTTLATLAKDATLNTLAKDTTLSAINTALGNIVTAINNQSSGSGSGSSSGGGATIENSTVTITSSGNTITGGTTSITGSNLETAITGGTTYVYGGTFTIDGVSAVLASNIYEAIDNANFASVELAAEVHNSIYRGENLGTAPTAAQLAAIRAGTFSGLWPGDYWTRSITYTDSGAGSSVTDTVVMRIAHINYPRTGSTPNIMVIPEYCLYNAKMNDSNTNSSGYKGSKMYTTYLAGAIGAFEIFFGSENLLTYTIDLSTSTSAFSSTSGRIVDLLNQYQVFGTAGSNGVASDPEQTQLAIFKLNSNMKIAKTKSTGSATYWWTRDPYSSNSFAAVNPSGASSHNYASNSFGVRPAALIG